MNRRVVASRALEHGRGERCRVDAHELDDVLLLQTLVPASEARRTSCQEETERPEHIFPEFGPST